MNKIFLSIISLVLLSGCASFVAGRKQEINVDTQGVKEAKCYLTNDKNTWYLPKTPGKIAVDISSADLKVVCVLDGYKTAHKTVESSTRGWVFGNVLLLPLAPVGAAVDVVNGAAYEYPKSVSLHMEAKPHVEDEDDGDWEEDW
jgi:uncharacterized protein YceK